MEEITDILQIPVEDRSERDIAKVVEFLSTFSAARCQFLPNSAKRYISKCAVLEVFSRAATVIAEPNDQLNAWAIVLEGKLCYCHKNEKFIFNQGDTFGVKPVLTPQHIAGVLFTLCDDCKLLCVAQKDLFAAFNEDQQ
ncbi:unnamed protein product [Clavelina lepadiformis]|uniref:Cyclic nucleotide-binding domain-containing protein n=1 Tax=Clavelina lepadiformis TaxID=159417 RepID=A0ABP0FKN1_CLALP